jgi:hypothetical protein
VSEVLERGDIFLFYGPRVGREEAHGVDDVQRFYVDLKPDGKVRYRRLIVGRKRLPDPEGREREWAFVAQVTDDPAPVRDELEPDARPAGRRGPLRDRRPRRPHAPRLRARVAARARRGAARAQRFGERRFSALSPPDFLDHEGAEVVLVAAAQDAERELGIDLDARAERLDDADLFAELRLRPRDLPIEPLTTGQWR